MNRKAISVLIASLLLLSVFLVGCTKIEKIYVCADGVEVPDKASCKVNKVAGITKQDAENYAQRYVTAFFTPYGGKAQLVSSYLDPKKGDYFATFIVAGKGGSPYETEVSVDGVTGKVTCETKCDYTG